MTTTTIDTLIAAFALAAALPALALDLPDLRRKAEQGDASAMYELGQAYRFGQGVPQDGERGPVPAAAGLRGAAGDLDGDLREVLGHGVEGAGAEVQRSGSSPRPGAPR